MISLLLQSGIDLSTRGITPAQTALSVLLLVIFGAILTAGSYLLQFRGLSDGQKRHKKALLGQREATSAATLRLRPGAVETSREQLRALFDGEPVPAEEASLLTAVGAVRQELGDAWGSYTSSIPRLARWLAELAVALSITASLVHVSVATYRGAFSGGSGLSLSAAVDEAVAAIQWLASTAVEALGAFPLADMVWALAFAYSVRIAQWLYGHPLPIIAVLVLAAAAVVLLDRRAPGARNIRVTTRFNIWTPVIGFGVVWLAGALPAAAGQWIGIPTVGAVAGVVSALAALLAFGYLIGRGIVRDTRALIRAANDPDRPAIAYLIVRRVGATVGVLAVPLVPLYLISAIATGRLGAIVAAFVAGSLAVQLAGLGLLLAAIIGAIWLARASIPELRAAVRNLLADTSVRLALLRRGMPVIIMLTVYLIVVGFGVSWFVAAALGLVAGAAARGAYYLFRRARYKVVTKESRDRTPSQVQVRAQTLEDADGEVVYYASVHTHDLAHDDPEQLVEAVCRVAKTLFDGESPGPSVEHAHAEDVFRFGIVDIEETRDKLEQTAVIEAEGRMEKRNGQYPDEKLEEKVRKQVPDDIWQPVRKRKLQRGEWSKRDGRYILHG